MRGHDVTIEIRGIVSWWTSSRIAASVVAVITGLVSGTSVLRYSSAFAF